MVTRRGFIGRILAAAGWAVAPAPLKAIAPTPTLQPIQTGFTTYLVGSDAIINVNFQDIVIGQWSDYMNISDFGLWTMPHSHQKLVAKVSRRRRRT